MASKAPLTGKNRSNKLLIKPSSLKAQRAGIYCDNVNPLAVLIFLPLASLHRNMRLQHKKASSSR